MHICALYRTTKYNIFITNGIDDLTYQTRNHEGCVAAPLLDIYNRIRSL